MDLDSAIQHCKEQVQEQAKKGCYSCAEEHQQLAEWLKELKAYRETWSKLGMWLADTRLAIAPDEFLNDVDEELVRVAQVDMIDTVSEWMDEHEVEAKQNCTDCIIDGTDACSRGAGRAVDDEICGDFIPSRSEIPNTCGDAISRQEALNAITMAEVRWQAVDNVNKLPSVTPQQRMGEWIEHFDEIGKWYECDQCHTDWGGPVNYCPNCGCVMKGELE